VKIDTDVLMEETKASAEGMLYCPGFLGDATLDKAMCNNFLRAGSAS